MRSGGHGRIVRHVFLSFGETLIIRDELLVTFRALLGLARFSAYHPDYRSYGNTMWWCSCRNPLPGVIRRIIRCYNRIRQQTVGSLIES